MSIKVGDRLPNAKFRVGTPEGPAWKTTDEIFKGKKVALFAVPGAFTGTCHKMHVPSILQNADAIKAIQAAFRLKRDYLLSNLQRLGVRIDRAPDGTFYVWGCVDQLPAPLSDGMGFFRAALEEKVIVVPGEFFDVNPGKRRPGHASRFKGYVRFSFGPEMAVLERAIQRFERLVAR